MTFNAVVLATDEKFKNFVKQNNANVKKINYRKKKNLKKIITE